ncbi:hypothetical protein BD410DRAFT_757056 [Rickenella mellea]|uniref:J domain-containing protein n=1 Tax=Rickenella mellea TaxID=50990 RepID=A0A4Y7PI40_9AGAM|nr:hypothetical protein BD410DRAFT_757056 [Rickenella mellea]
MANYTYDEGGGMASYFLLTFLSLVLVPLTYTLLPTSKKAQSDGCQCTPCLERRETIRRKDRRSLLNPKLGTKTVAVTLGWLLFAFVAYKVSQNTTENKVYNPFEILGIRSGTPEKEIKSHYKKLSVKFHPDKVRLAANQTAESVAAYFVEITKAYKSLTDETIRKNLELYGHPDGRQEISMGIAIPRWVIEGNNKFLVLVVYCILIGGLLPFIVGKWWFGNRIKTKDGVYAKTAEVFFKGMKEDSAIDDIFSWLGKVFEWENPQVSQLQDLETKVRAQLGRKYEGSRALTLLYAHLLRIPIDNARLRREQESLLLRTPTLLASLLNIALSHNWLLPSLSAMRMHSYLTQALQPPSSNLTSSEAAHFAQLPGFNKKDVEDIAGQIEEDGIPAFLNELEKRGDKRVSDVQKAAATWGSIELVDASFKVLGERIVTPSSIVQLLVKLRVTPPGSVVHPENDEEDVDRIKAKLKANDEKDNTFLASRKDAEDMSDQELASGWAHAPFWPARRKQSWWLLLADEKTNRVVVPPMKITDVPLSNPTKDRNYRAYKLQFQAPQGVGLYTWKVYLVSDTFVGEEAIKEIVLKIDDVSSLNADEQGAEDEISDPEEDSLAGQMAAMRGGAVKKVAQDEDSDEESSTDDDKSSGESSSDSD